MTKKEKYNKLLEVFEDPHISEIEHAFAKYAPLCSEARCEECPLAIGESCIKIAFEQKWELQDLCQKQREILKILKNKKVDLNLILGCGGLAAYNMCCYVVGNELTQEEYDLIKEWLEGEE